MCIDFSFFIISFTLHGVRWLYIYLPFFAPLTPSYTLFSGNMLTFLVGSKQAFEVSLADVSQAQLQGKTDVYLEFHVDDTTGANEVFYF